MSEFSHEDRNFIMACYTVALCNDENLIHDRIKCSTIKLYLASAARLSVPSEKLDPTKNRFGQQSEFIAAILREHKRCEQMSNRRSPLTPRMIKSAHEEPQCHPDALNTALLDWLILNMYLGARKCEWCQDASYLKKHRTFSKNIDGSSQAFTLEDFEFLGTGNKRVKINTVFHEESSITGVRIRWKFQKNNDNGQKLTYFINKLSPKMCPVMAARNICARAMRLRIDPKGPIAIYSPRPGTTKCHFINNILVEKRLQFLATRTYDLTEKEDMARYTCHSLRVGACVLLHTSNASPDTIKLRLRWKSDSYLMYLRDTVKLASNHNLAMSTADPDGTDLLTVHNLSNQDTPLY